MENRSNTVVLKVTNLLGFQTKLLKRFKSQRFVFTLQENTNRHKIFQVVFGKDGSLYITFPYYMDTQGLLARASISSFLEKEDIHLDEIGKFTSHLVKYSHHPDGFVLFSQDGKVISQVRKQSIPLKELGGHIFSIQFRGLKRFKLLTEKDERDEAKGKKVVLNFDGSQSASKAYRIVGRWYEAGRLVERFSAKEVGPIVTAIQPSGVVSKQFLIGSPKDFPFATHVLAIACFEDTDLDEGNEEFFSFVGGFDRIAPRREIKRQEFLIFKYPVEEANDELKNQLGTIDFS